VPMKAAMEVVESVKSSGEGKDVKMTAFVNLGNEEGQKVAVNQEIVEPMKEAVGETSEKLMKATKNKKASKKEKLVAMAMSRLKKMELGMDNERGDMRMENMMRLIALEPQIIGPVVEVRNGPQLDGLNIMGMGKQRMARSLTL